MLNYNTLRYRSEWQLSPIRLNQSFPSAAVVHGSDVFSIAPADCTYIPVCRTSLVASFFSLSVSNLSSYTCSLATYFDKNKDYNHEPNRRAAQGCRHPGRHPQ